MSISVKPGDTRPVFIEPFDLYLFGRGEHWDLYRVLGAHPEERDGLSGFRFAVWAPNAREVCLAGSFNDWHWGDFPLYPVGSSGIWAAFVPGICSGDLYKFGIKGGDGRIVYKTDPMAFFAELRPGNAAVACGLHDFAWGDQDWLADRAASDILRRPVSVYEVHAGSWRRHHGDFPFLSYDELADQLIPYVKDLGFTHIEFMPLAEHPLDLSWGYQTGHYYAPTSRFGRPEQLKSFINRCHQAGIGVILDWVPAHFPKDEWSLGRFDGTALYEHSDPRKGEHPDWGTYIFNYGRHEVRNFILANALYWLKEFHFDGLRIDAVASMLYLDYSRKEGEWVPNSYGGKENIEAIEFLRELNTVVHGQFPGAITVAEESTAWPGVSRPVYTGGLGFTFKWNMGWMNDTLGYMQQNPVFRSFQQNVLTFSMLYAFSENFVLPLSHDEVVHGKKSLAAKMPGDAWQQQANLRLLYAYMWAHSGKKMLFMGSELGQWNEWAEDRELDWMLLDFPAHRGIGNLVRDLNGILRREPAMHADDNDWQGFSWVDFSDYQASIMSFMRQSEGVRPVFWVFNFTPVPRYNYKIGSPAFLHHASWHEVLNTDSEYYGGGNVGNPGSLPVVDRNHDKGFLSLTLPPLAALALMPDWA
ncbi:MAG: 1,4-alpha-glucan branching protein GlgB [Deltaproteobacteria bacterium]|jgi:1,4-alpha-glucan branching enzyme|nr:1,4-alpha-glucan branching protein GlgB [Deltaproteobacteria bacterium]